MKKSNHKLKPDETVQKMLVSTTSRMVGEYESDTIVITLALSSNDLPPRMRIIENPLSRSAYIIALETPPRNRNASITVPNYSATGETICAYLSVLFGKRFDFHGSVERTGYYQIPDLAAYGRICNPKLPFNSHEERSCFPVPMKIDRFESIERIFTDPKIDKKLLSKLDAVCKFYMQALQNAEIDPEIAYLHLITAGEILSSFFSYSQKEILDQETLKDLETIKNEIEGGDSIAKRMSGRLTSVKRSFVKSLCSLLDDPFYTTDGTEENTCYFTPANIEKSVGAAYDLRSTYVHTGVSFERLIEPSVFDKDLRPDNLVVDDKNFAKILRKAPTFPGLERLMRYCILRFMSSRKLLDPNPE